MQPLPNIPEYSVSEISTSIKKTVEERFSYVRVRGEISGFKAATSGHVYLNLKDESSVLAAVMWRGSTNNINFKPEDGLEVICTGRITTFSGQSKYQLIIDKMEASGIGALMALLEKRKQQLAKEGLFDSNRKKPIPIFPTAIGVITSETGAVIEDIKHRIEERFPLKIILWPVLVQGDKAANQVSAAINGFNQLPEKPDVIIVARGGGSIEDLWPFNEEIVVRATANSTIPIISAVGHETDVTLIDFAADLRAPTPSAAAEKATPRTRSDLLAAIADLDRRKIIATERNLKNKTEFLQNLSRALAKPDTIVMHWQQRLDLILERLKNALPVNLERKNHLLQQFANKIKHPLDKVNNLTQKLESLKNNLQKTTLYSLNNKEQKLNLANKLLDSYHYKNVLKRGFTVITDANSKVVTSSTKIKTNDKLNIEFFDGKKGAVAE